MWFLLNVSKCYLNFFLKDCESALCWEIQLLLIDLFGNKIIICFAFLHMLEFVLKTVVGLILGNESRRINID